LQSIPELDRRGTSFGGSGSRRSLFTVFTLFLKTAIICAPSHSGQGAQKKAPAPLAEPAPLVPHGRAHAVPSS
jgi:hypothetical protein